MTTSYPTTLDTSGGTLRTDILSTTDMDDSGFEHDLLHVNVHGAVIALETKLGIGASPALTAAANAILVANGSGSSTWAVTAITNDTSGNAATATVLATARTIGGVSFDGSGNISLPGVDTAGTQDTSGNATTATSATTAGSATTAATVTTAAQPAITSVGSLTALTVSGAITVTGNVDGRDVAADGTKLDGIESAATADQTLSDIKALGFAKVTVSAGAPAGPATGDIWIDT